MSIVVGDISTLDGMRQFAEQVNRGGVPDAVIHNAGVYGSGGRQTDDGMPETFAVNTLAPYVLTALIERPETLVYPSSGMHLGVQPDLADALWRTRRWDDSHAYSESKLCVTALSFALARLWPETSTNAVDPGWVTTRMGGRGASDDINQGYATQVALVIQEDPRLRGVTGAYLYHIDPRTPARLAEDVRFQNRLLELLRSLSGVALREA